MMDLDCQQPELLVLCWQGCGWPIPCTQLKSCAKRTHVLYILQCGQGWSIHKLNWDDCLSNRLTGNFHNYCSLASIVPLLCLLLGLEKGEGKKWKCREWWDALFSVRGGEADTPPGREGQLLTPGLKCWEVMGWPLPLGLIEEHMVQPHC